MKRAGAESRRELLAAADALGLQLIVAEIGSDRDYEATFDNLIEHGAEGLLVSASPIFASDADEIITLTLRH